MGNNLSVVYCIKPELVAGILGWVRKEGGSKLEGQVGELCRLGPSSLHCLEEQSSRVLKMVLGYAATGATPQHDSET